MSPSPAQGKLSPFQYLLRRVILIIIALLFGVVFVEGGTNSASTTSTIGSLHHFGEAFVEEYGCSYSKAAPGPIASSGGAFVEGTATLPRRIIRTTFASSFWAGSSLRELHRGTVQEPLSQSPYLLGGLFVEDYPAPPGPWRWHPDCLTVFGEAFVEGCPATREKTDREYRFAFLVGSSMSYVGSSHRRIASPFWWGLR